MFAQCNGMEHLCDRRYNEVVYVMTHNAYNHADGFTNFPNQSFDIERQLADGVRGMMIDIYERNEVVTAYHGAALFGWEPLVDVLPPIKDFLDNNPNEVLTIIFESYVTSDRLYEVLVETGLDAYLHVHQQNTEWETLGEIIASNKRLVVFSESDNAQEGQDWYHYIWDFSTETHFSVSDKSEFNCDFNRGNPNNELFILNHFIGSKVGTGLIGEAEVINQYDYLHNRATECMVATGKLPNFLAIDFHEQGEPMRVADTLNSQMLSSIHGIAGRIDLTVFPNPARDVAFFELGEMPSEWMNFELYDMLGKTVYTSDSIQNTQFQVPLHGLSKGIYFYKISNVDGSYLGQGKLLVE